jgi:hypothetical protein
MGDNGAMVYASRKEAMWINMASSADSQFRINYAFYKFNMNSLWCHPYKINAAGKCLKHHASLFFFVSLSDLFHLKTIMSEVPFHESPEKVKEIINYFSLRLCVASIALLDPANERKTWMLQWLIWELVIHFWMEIIIWWFDSSNGVYPLWAWPRLLANHMIFRSSFVYSLPISTSVLKELPSYPTTNIFPWSIRELVQMIHPLLQILTYQTGGTQIIALCPPITCSSSSFSKL